MQRLLCLLFILYTVTSQAQTLTPGGLAPTGRPLVLTADKQLNQRYATTPQQISWLQFDDSKEKPQVAPLLPDTLSWIALFNLPVKGKAHNFFVYDGWMAATQRIATNHRLRRFEEDITQQISSNAYHMAFQRKQVVENEVFMLLVSPKKQKVVVELKPEQFSVHRRLEYNMDEGEAKFVHLVIPPPEYTVITWQPEQTARKQTPLTNWQFYFDSSGRKTKSEIANLKSPLVSLPHTWNAIDIFDSRNFKDSLNIMELFRRGVGWYKTSFSIPASEKDKQHGVHFLGANQVAEVWLNGAYLGKHIGGYTGFSFPLNKYLRYGTANELLVKVDSRYSFHIPPHTADYNFLGGIYREVYLTSTHAAHIQQTKFTTPRVSHRNAAVNINTTINNSGVAKKLVVNLVNPYNEIQQSWVLPVHNQRNFNITDTVKNPVLWSPSNPVLYKLYSTLYDAQDKPLDQTVTNVGFRYFDFRADSGFFFNGQPLKLKGVNVHQDYLNRGWAVDSAQKREDYLWMKKMGVNYVRMSHYPKHPYELHLCDSLGFVVWEEIPVVNTVGRDSFIANAKMMMREMIARDYNHPSVVFWGVGNEYYRNFFTAEDAAYALRSTRECAAVAKALDPYRYTIQAQNDLVDERIMSLTDIQGRNRYFGWYEKTYNDFAQEMEEERKKHPDWKLLVSEYGAEGKYGHHVAASKIFDHSETYQVDFHKAYWKVISEQPYLAGGTIWNMFDFASFAKIGNSAHINKKGMLTFDRKPKDVFYYYQSVWTDEPMLRIAGHTYTHRRTVIGKPTNIEVFSNADEVELFVNGASQGRRKRAEGYTWQVPLAEGYHRIRAVANNNTLRDETGFYLRLVQPAADGEGIKDLDGDGF